MRGFQRGEVWSVDFGLAAKVRPAPRRSMVLCTARFCNAPQRCGLGLLLGRTTLLATLAWFLFLS